MSIVLKRGVSVGVLMPQTLLAIMISEQIYSAHGLHCRLTCVYEPDHKLHTKGHAVDLGIKDPNGEVYPDLILTSIVEELRGRLGEEYDVVDERDAPGGPHIHIEYDPQ